MKKERKNRTANHVRPLKDSLAYNLNTGNMQKILDKVVHFFIYFLIALASYICFVKSIKIKKLLPVSVVFFVCGYGILMEFMHYFIRYRSFSTDDIIFNYLGAAIFGIIIIPKKGYD